MRYRQRDDDRLQNHYIFKSGHNVSKNAIAANPRSTSNTYKALLIDQVRFGSLAVITADTSLMSAFGGKAVIRQPDFGGPGPNVRFHLKRSLELVNLSNFNVCFRPEAATQAAAIRSLFGTL